jgi:hypothetical protein
VHEEEAQVVVVVSIYSFQIQLRQDNQVDPEMYLLDSVWKVGGFEPSAKNISNRE